MNCRSMTAYDKDIKFSSSFFQASVPLYIRTLKTHVIYQIMHCRKQGDPKDNSPCISIMQQQLKRVYLRGYWSSPLEEKATKYGDFRDKTLLEK